MAEKPTRHLAAIMFADMVGYTALMQADEEEARVQRDRHRELISAAVQRHHGEILQYYGDGTLSIFASAVEAVECAVETQLELSRESVIPLRIGVHTGDIVHDDDGIYGDGVNVASRIEGLSAPGGVMVSGKVFDEIKNRPSLSAVPMGLVPLKNVEHPVPVFAISNEGLTVPDRALLPGEQEPTGTRKKGRGVSKKGPESGSAGSGLTQPEDTYLQRIKDRFLVQWALAYLAGAWAVLEIVGFSSEQFSWSPLVSKGFALLAIAGFFVTLVITWYHGEPGRQRVSGPELLMIALLLAIGGGAFAVLGPGAGEEGPGGSLSVRWDRPSIAVLPFLNMSAEGQEEAAFLAAGLHDELLTQLSKIASLDVIARTSVMQYAGTEKTVAMIAGELGVHTILEGSLMRAGDQVRLNVQLIDAETSTHLWADTYDREFTVANVFNIQSELARQVVGALEAEFVPAEEALIAEVPTESLDAYTFYLRANEALNRPGSAPQDLDEAERMLVRATEADPRFSLAHAWLSTTHSLQYLFYDRTPARLEQARESLEEALAPNPEMPEGNYAKAFYHYHRYENEEAFRALALAERGLPGSYYVLTLKSELLIRGMEWDASLAARERAVVLDPLNTDAALNLAGAYADLERWEEANVVFDRILEDHPDFHEAAFVRGYFIWRRTGDGRLGLAALAQVPPDVEVFGLRSFFGWLMTDPDGRVTALDGIEQPILDFGGFWWAPRDLLEAWTYRNLDPDRAEGAFERAVLGCQEALEGQPGDPRIHASLGRALAALGRREEAIREAETVVEMLPIEVDPVFGRDLLWMTSIIYADLGMADEAIDGLETVLSVPGVFPLGELAFPEFDAIRSDPRFQEILRRYPEIPPGLESLVSQR